MPFTEEETEAGRGDGSLACSGIQRVVELALEASPDDSKAPASPHHICLHEPWSPFQPYIYSTVITYDLNGETRDKPMKN